MAVFVSLLVLIGAGALYAVFVTWRLRSVTSKSCSRLLEEMRYVDLKQIHLVAREVKSVHHHSLAARLEFLDRLGGVDGLKHLRENAARLTDIARCLALMDPGSHELTDKIYRDAAKVHTTATILYWQCLLRLQSVRIPLSAPQLALAYAELSANSLRLCERLVDEISPLLQEAVNVHERMLRANRVLPLTGMAE